MKPVLAAAFGLALAATAAPAFAHHSGAMYDTAHLLTAGATVKSFEWINPHAQLTLLLDATASAPAQPLLVEMSGPGVMTRAGMTKRSFQPGDHIKLTYAPRYDGGSVGLFQSGTTAKGEVLNLTFKPGEAANLK